MNSLSMSLFLQDSASDDKKLDKFYRNIRHHVDDLVESTSGEPGVERPRVTQTETGRELDEIISKKEFLHILEAYESQQESENFKDQHVLCEKIQGSSFERLLHSKIGFHNLASTDILVKDLGLENAHKHSFLGGYSPYNLTKEEDLEGLKRAHDIHKARANLRLANQHLDKKEVRKAQEEVDRALEILDREDIDVLRVKGRVYLAQRSYGHAERKFKEALRKENLSSKDRDEIQKSLAECLFEEGHSYYIKAAWHRALEKFDETLRYDRENPNALLHKHLCHQNLNQHTPFGQQKHSENSRRK